MTLAFGVLFIAIVFTSSVNSEKSKNQFDYDLVCKGDMQVVLHEFFGSVSCFADAFGIKNEEVKGKYPPRMSKCIPTSMMKSKALSNPQRFKKWLCSQERPDQHFDLINECIANITEKEDQLMHDCYVELAGRSIRQQVCMKNNQRELSWQYQEFQCLQQAHGNNFTCWSDTFGKQDLPVDEKSFGKWLCDDEYTPVELVHAFEVCTFAISEQQDESFYKCLSESAKKFI